MLFFCIFLLLCLTISITINVISIKLNIKAGGIIRRYEKFYEDTLDEAIKVINYFEELLNNNTMIAEDGDVDRVRRYMKSFYDILVGYINAIPKNKEESERD